MRVWAPLHCNSSSATLGCSFIFTCAFLVKQPYDELYFRKLINFYKGVTLNQPLNVLNAFKINVHKLFYVVHDLMKNPLVIVKKPLKLCLIVITDRCQHNSKLNNQMF